jgi:type VI secretion system protein ImpG
MADTPGRTTSPLMVDLLQSGHQFSFVQVMRLARRFLDPRGAEGLPEVPWQDRVRIRPELSLAFPAADVARVERVGADLRVTATFLGLYGTSSPLPIFYTEDLLDEASCDESVIRDFLDIVHQRLYHLYFQCWSKYRLFIRVVEENNPVDRERLYCLIGLGEKELRDTVPDSWSLLRYAGILSQYPRSALGLKTLLRDVFAIKSIRITQNVQRMVPIPADQRLSMGTSCCRLGVDAVLGSEIADQMGKFRIEIGPLSWEGYNDLVPGTPLHEKLVRYVRFYLVDPLAVELKLILAAGEAKPLRLGDPTARLGLNTWCFAGETLGEMSTVFPLALSATEVPPPAANEYNCSPERTEPYTLIEYYQKELAQLRDLANGYAEAHPNHASMISGHSTDPGVERLFEGVAFLNATLQKKIDDDFPELINNVITAIQPDYLRPVPASTIIVFAPKANCTEPQIIPVGTELKSVPVDGTSCRFTTCYPVEIHPLTLTNVSFAQPAGKSAAITLSFTVTGIALSNWKVENLRLFLAGESKHAVNLYLVLLRYLKRIVITPTLGGQPITLDATNLTAVDFEGTDRLFSPDAAGVAKHLILHEYFIRPDRFMFLDLALEKWRGRGEGTEFEIRFELNTLPFALHQVSTADILLFATPAVNIFQHRAEPIDTNDQLVEYQIKPAENHFGHYDIHSVKSVVGLLNNTSHKISFQSMEQGSPQSTLVPTYQIKRRKAAIRDGLDAFLSIVTPQKTASQQITSLVVELACTNGNLPERLQIGDICKDSDNSPGFAEFTNCKTVTRSECINLGNNTLWRQYSHFNVNVALLDIRSLRAMLEQVSQSFSRDYLSAKLQENRIKGITGFQIKQTDRLMGRSMLRGWEIRIVLDSAFYDSPGDLFLFGSLLDHFLRGFATESCFTRTIVENVQGGRTYEWPARMGRRALV